MKIRQNPRKSRRLVVAGLFALAISSVSGALAAYLETNGERPDEPALRRPMPPISRPSPVPGPENAVTRLVRRLEVLAPVSSGRITMYPLALRTPNSTGIRILDEALRHGWITVEEKERAEVPEVLVRNQSRHYVLLMAGEIIAGGRQNRIVRDDVLLSPDSGLIAVPVYCGEKERWGGSSTQFSGAGCIADIGLRKMAAAAEPQARIWEDIDRKLAGAKVRAPTRSYWEIYQDRTVSADMDKAADTFKRISGSHTVGAVIVRDGRIVSCDLFSDAGLFSDLWNKISRSYVLNEILYDKDGRHGHSDYVQPVDRTAVEQFLNNVLVARFGGQSTPGTGERLAISGPVEGSALTWRSEVVHALVFPGEITPVPMRDDSLRLWNRN